MGGELQWLARKCESLSEHPHGKVGCWRQAWILLTAVASHPDNYYASRLGGTCSLGSAADCMTPLYSPFAFRRGLGNWKDADYIFCLGSWERKINRKCTSCAIGRSSQAQGERAFSSNVRKEQCTTRERVEAGCCRTRQSLAHRNCPRSHSLLPVRRADYPARNILPALVVLRYH